MHTSPEPVQGTATGFMRSQALQWLVVSVLSIVLIAALVGTWLTGQGHVVRVASVAPMSTACHPVVVTFADTASMKDIHQLLQGTGASLAAGPDMHGSFTLDAVSGNAQALVDALNQAPDLVVIASLTPNC